MLLLLLTLLLLFTLLLLMLYTVALPHGAGSGEVIRCSAVVLAVGHSARSMYRTLVAREVQITPKGFAVSALVILC